MKFFKSILPFLFIAVVLFLAIFLFIRIGKNNLFFNNSNNAADTSNTEISAGEPAQGGSKNQFKNIEANILSSIDFDTYGYKLDVVGGFAYIGRLHSLDIIDIKDKNNPVRINTIENERWANKVIADNGYLYLLSDYSLIVIDNSDPNDPDIISEMDFEGFDPKAILDKDLLYLTASTVSGSVEGSAFYIVDISSKRHPGILSSAKLLRPVYGIYLNDGVIYLSGSGVVYEVELDNYYKPKIIAELKFSGWINDILFRDEIAFMAGNNGLTVWDFSIKNNPVIISTIDIGGYGKKLFLNEDRLFIFSNSEYNDNNFLVADISDIKNYDFIGKISSVQINGYPQDLKFYKGDIFLLSNEMVDYKGDDETAANEVKSRLYILNLANKIVE
jgi:hypothetical protein